MQQLRRELGAALKLCPWVLVALLLVGALLVGKRGVTLGTYR